MLYKCLKYIVLIPLISACYQSKDGNQVNISIQPTNTVQYAKRFAIVNSTNFKLLYIFGNRNNFDTTAKFLFAKDTVGVRLNYPNVTLIQTPIHIAAALGSIYANMIEILGSVETIAAVDNISYISNPKILEKFAAGQILELAKTPQIDIEKTIRLKPNVIFTFGMGEGEKDIDKKITLTKIPLVVIVDHLEESLLARAEWLKVIALFINKENVADSLFNLTKNNYLKFKQQAAEVKNKPSVFTEFKMGDIWYMPGGKSFMSQLLQDAGANYLWADNEKFGSMPLSFEQVVARAKNADYWLNPSTFNSKTELLKSESRYQIFKAFQTNKIYNNNKNINQFGYSNYWETGMIYPDRILSDLIQIFHPEIKQQSTVNLYYYKKLD